MFAITDLSRVGEVALEVDVRVEDIPRLHVALECVPSVQVQRGERDDKLK